MKDLKYKRLHLESMLYKMIIRIPVNKEPVNLFNRVRFKEILEHCVRDFTTDDTGNKKSILDIRLTTLISTFIANGGDKTLLPNIKDFIVRDSKMDEIILQELKAGTLTYTCIITSTLAWLYRFMASNGEPCKIKEQDFQCKLTGYMALIEDWFRYQSACLDVISKDVFHTWEYNLSNLNIRQRVDHFNLVVSLGNLDWFMRHDKIISASYITGRNYTTYDKASKRIGWCFNVNKNDVVGMCKDDCNSRYVRGTLTHAFSDFYEAVLQGAFYIEEYCYVPIPFPDFLEFNYPNNLEKADGYNEIILHGDTRPSGVFLICENEEERDNYYMTAVFVAKTCSLPLVVLYKDSGIVEIIQPHELPKFRMNEDVD